tara:strand:+ start:2115 stop:2291 length:177 start_codon:yes stop_codon:yes gene_type:complete
MDNINIKEAVKLYIDSMDSFEKEAYVIAQEQLETSFDIVKSIGFINFIKINNYKIDNN